MKTLVLAEKKSQASDLSKGLEKYGGSFKQGNRCLENDRYIITWAEGHVLALMEPRDHENWGEKRKWELSALPWYPPNFEFTYKVGKDRVYTQLKPIFARKDIQDIIVATDAGREGTLIAHELIDHFGLTVPVKRFYESAVLTPKNIQHIIENDLKDSSFVLPRRDAAYARAFADLILGMNFTIGFSAKAGSTLSLGRVKTPTMAILAQRKKEILAFKEEKYFELEADFEGVYTGLWFKDKLGNTKFASKEEVSKMSEKVKGKTGRIIKKEVLEKPENPKLLFNLNDLQGEASSKFGFDPNETLDIAQSLYDTHKILSYPRSESRVIGTEHEKLLPNVLGALKDGPYDNFVQEILDKGIPTTSRMVNDKKLSDHHALIPTEVTPNLSKLNANERKIYDLVVKRFLAAFYPAAMYEKTEVVTEVEGETFKTSGRIEVDKGWKVVYGDAAIVDDDDSKDEEGEATLPPIQEGESRSVASLKALDKKTSPPKLYSYKQLLTAMENPKKFLQSKELKDALDSAEAEAGLGTSATRGDILKDLMDREYIEKKGKNVDITDFGLKLIEVSPEQLKSPEITAEWEGKLRKMETGKYDFKVFMDEIREYIQSILSELENASWDVKFPNKNSGGEEITKCPTCGTSIRNIGKVFVCEESSPESPCFIVSTKIGKKSISDANVKELVEKGETKTIKGFTAKSGNKFDAKLKMDGKKITFEFDTGDVATCPHCSKPIKDIGSIYVCQTNTKENNCFIVSKTIAKKKIPPTVIKELAEKGVSSLIKGLTAKSGNKFDAKLKLDGKKITFEFENKPKTETKKTDLSCPFCQTGKIQENSKAFGCTNWKENCKFTLWKNGKAIQLKHVESLISEGNTGRIDGLKNKGGKIFSAKYKLNTDSKAIEMEFVND